MLWQLPASVRSLALPASAQLRRRYGVTARLLHDAPLRILFCGSDAFSIASLRALHSAKCEHADLIASIEVAHRPAKLTGRGLKTLHEGV
jgi:methionyl-tRNA formyltransferase